jgi:hypothetical protein
MQPEAFISKSTTASAPLLNTTTFTGNFLGGQQFTHLHCQTTLLSATGL